LSVIRHVEFIETWRGLEFILNIAEVPPFENSGGVLVLFYSETPEERTIGRNINNTDTKPSGATYFASGNESQRMTDFILQGTPLQERSCDNAPNHYMFSSTPFSSVIGLLSSGAGSAKGFSLGT